MWRRSVLSACAALWLLNACVTPGESLRPRAAFDLQCSEQHLTMTELGGQCGAVRVGDDATCTMGVSGCGRQATYVLVNSTWVKNDSTVSR